MSGFWAKDSPDFSTCVTEGDELADFSANITFDHATIWEVKTSLGYEPEYSKSQDERKSSMDWSGWSGLDRDLFISLPERGPFLESDFPNFRSY